MNPTNEGSQKTVVILGILVLVLVVILFVMAFYHTAGAPTTTTTTAGPTVVPTSTAPAGGTTAATGGTTSKSPAPTTTNRAPSAPVSSKSPASPQPPVISFITPPAGDSWPIETQNTIIWNKPGGISGELVLVNAGTGTVAGVILSQVGPEQTSYTWNTRDLYLNRTSPTETTVTPGKYMVMLSYDGNHITPVVSPVFSIVQ